MHEAFEECTCQVKACRDLISSSDGRSMIWSAKSARCRVCCVLQKLKPHERATREWAGPYDKEVKLGKEVQPMHMVCWCSFEGNLLFKTEMHVYLSSKRCIKFYEIIIRMSEPAELKPWVHQLINSKSCNLIVVEMKSLTHLCGIDSSSKCLVGKSPWESYLQLLFGEDIFNDC